MISFPFFIARRIYGDRTENWRFSRPAIRIAIGGIAVGLATMIISIAVVMGFKREVSGKVIGFGGHAQILSLTQDQNYVVYPVVTNDSLRNAVKKLKGVGQVMAFATKSGMLKTDEDFCGIMLKGVGEDYDLSFIKSYLVDGELPEFSAKESSNKILLSRRIADALHLKVGDRVFAYFIQTGDMRARRFSVAGIYETHLAEYDKLMCLTDIRTIRKLNNWTNEESSGFEVRMKETVGQSSPLLTSQFQQIDEMTSRIGLAVNHTLDQKGASRGAFSIRELAPHIFSWLEVLDMNVVMILLLMMAIAAFTIVSGLLIVMLERIQMIGILKALGATNGQIRGVFRNFGIMLVGQAVLIGDVCAIGFCWLQQRFKFIKLNAENYYIDSVPIHLDVLSIVLVNVAVLIISSFVIYGASYLVSIKGPASTIRWE